MRFNHEQSHLTPANRPASGGTPSRARIGAYLRLAFGLILVALFMSVATFLNARSPALRTLAERIDAYGLRPSAIYYTDYEASGDAAALIRSSLEYSPRGPN
jgi:hypothetical protein